MNILRLISLFLLFYSCFLFAETPAYDSSGLLSLPSVQVGTTESGYKYYNVGLQRVEGGGWLFELSAAIETTEVTSATYAGGELVVSNLAYATDLYSTKFLLVENSSPLRFTLSSASKLCSNCLYSTQGAIVVSGLTFSLSETSSGSSATTTGTITFNANGTFQESATNSSGHFVAGGTWSQTNDEVTIHFTSYQYDNGDGQEEYNGATMTGTVYPNKAVLSDSTTSMTLSLTE